MSKKKKRRLNVLRTVLLALLLLTFIVVGVGAGFVVGVVKNLPDLKTELNPDITTFIHDKEGNEVAELHGVENRIPVKLEQIPDELVEAFIATEDRSFYDHPGINPVAFIRAALANFRAGKIVQGGSTVTMQLAENAFFADKPERTYKRKIQEAIMAIQLERHYTKNEILEAYLNQIYFGHGAYGVQAAAETYFGKDVEELTLSECAMIAGVTNNPALYSPFRNESAAKDRQAVVLQNMVESGLITETEAEAAKKEAMELAELKQKSSNKYPYFVDAVVLEAEKLLQEKGLQPADLYRSGLHIYTTLAVDIQKEMEDVYDNPNNFPSSPDDVPVQSAMVVLDPLDGEIRGIIGGREHSVERGLNRAIQGRRQPGSAIKPVAVYAPALEQGFTPATVIDDVPVTYQAGSEPYSPSNYDGRYRGLVSMREAIRWSINIPAVKMLETIGIDTGYQFAKELGLSLVNSDRNLSLALGGLTHGISPLELASAYGSFANQGVWVEPHTITKITDREGNTLIEVAPKKRVAMSEQTAYLITNMLQTVVNSGTATRARISGRPVAGKTGTTQLPDLPAFENRKGERDAWFVGYTPELVGVVWLGYDKTTTTHYLKGTYGGTGCAPIWKDVISTALQDKPVKDFSRPDGILWATVDAKSGKLPGELTPQEFVTQEIFARGTVPTEVSDVWVKGEVCAETGKLPTPFCPEIITKVFLQRTVPYTGTPKPEDAELEQPEEECTLHGIGSSVQIRICTDPRHHGIPYLANVPVGNQEGGCPAEYIEIQTFSMGNVPQEYCSIPEHQIEGGGNNSGPPVVSLRGEVSQTAGGENIEIDLQWEMTPYPGHIIYSIERWTEDKPTKYNVAMTTKKSWTDKKVRNNTVYYYRVTAIDSNSKVRIPSNDIRIMIQGPSQ